MCSAMTDNTTMGLLIEQMVSTITEIDGQTAIENALRWLRRECRCERAMFYQLKGGQLLTFVTSNVDDRWGQAYRTENMIAHDPVARYYRNNLGFLDWRDALSQYLPPAWYEALLEDCRLAPAISYGYTSPCRGVNAVTSILSLAGLSFNTTPNDKYLITSLVPVLHRVGRGIQFSSRGLTQKELETLQWAREGKTAWEISVIRDVSEATVKYHLKTIYAKLGVANRAQAVGEALCRGFIS